MTLNPKPQTQNATPLTLIQYSDQRDDDAFMVLVGVPKQRREPVGLGFDVSIQEYNQIALRAHESGAIV
jgi:hypothetical protein